MHNYLGNTADLACVDHIPRQGGSCGAVKADCPGRHPLSAHGNFPGLLQGPINLVIS